MSLRAGSDAPNVGTGTSKVTGFVPAQQSLQCTCVRAPCTLSCATAYLQPTAVPSCVCCNLRPAHWWFVMGDPQDKPNQRCCLGMLYYSQAMESQGQRPVCLGIPHTPQESVQLPDQKQLAEPVDYKFMCLGHSLYEKASTSGRHSSSTADSEPPRGSKLPYCEGLEVILGKTLEAPAPAATTAGLPPGAAAHPPDDLSAVLTSMFGGEDSPVVKGAARFNKIASRNWERMKTTASQAYSMTIKPLIDKLSDQ